MMGAKGRNICINVIKSGGIMLATTGLSLLFHQRGFTDANIIMVYILGVVVISTVASHQIYSLIASIGSVLIFNYLFTEPRFSFSAYETGYPVTFLTMFLTAYLTGRWALRYKEQAGQEARIAYRTQVLLDTAQLLAKAKNKQEILDTAGSQSVKLLSRGILIYENVSDALFEPKLYACEGKAAAAFSGKDDQNAAAWVLARRQSAGANTEHFPDANYYYLAICANDRIYGVMGVESGDRALERTEHGILLSILGEVALALENEVNVRAKEEAAILAENERLRANLLRTISHDLRTPLTSISGNASNLLKNGDCFNAAEKQQIYTDIYNDSLWLINLVENLLYATRIEDGRMTLSPTPELISEIIGAAMQHVSHRTLNHQVVVDCPDELLMVKADAHLLVQVVFNLIDNALKYSPAGSTIQILAKKRDHQAIISVSDTGAGVSDAEKEKVFDKFYTGHSRIADNRRSLGLGLYLCKAIVEVHGGTIWVEDNHPHGAVFCFTLPLEEVLIYEADTDSDRRG